MKELVKKLSLLVLLSIFSTQMPAETIWNWNAIRQRADRFDKASLTKIAKKNKLITIGLSVILAGICGIVISKVMKIFKIRRIRKLMEQNLDVEDLRKLECLAEKNGIDISEFLNVNKLLGAATILFEPSMVRELVQNYGADVNAQDEEGLTALMLATIDDRLGMVRCLLDEGADVDVKYSDSLTALMFAVISGHKNVAKCLIETGGASVNAQNKDGVTVLIGAATLGQLDMVRYLLSKRANVEARDKYGETALLYAAMKGHEDIVRCLVKTGGADVNAQNEKGETALIEAAMKKRVDVVKFLIGECGAEVSYKVIEWLNKDVAVDGRRAYIRHGTCPVNDGGQIVRESIIVREGPRKRAVGDFMRRCFRSFESKILGIILTFDGGRGISGFYIDFREDGEPSHDENIEEKIRLCNTCTRKQLHQAEDGMCKEPAYCR